MIISYGVVWWFVFILFTPYLTSNCDTVVGSKCPVALMLATLVYIARYGTLHNGYGYGGDGGSCGSYL